VPGFKLGMSVSKLFELVGELILLSVILGPGDVFQQTPLSIITLPPSLPMLQLITIVLGEYDFVFVNVIFGGLLGV
jgi:hypothetical protein